MVQLRNYMQSLMSFLLDHKDAIALLVSIVVGISTIVTSIVSISIMTKQSRLAEEQNEIQKLQNQPVFDIGISQQQDSDDGKYGTDILEIRNIGEKMTSCEITTNVYFALSYHNLSTNDTIYAEVKDYFMATVHFSNDNGLVEKRWAQGNNRIFCEGYAASIKDSKDGTFYFYDKIVLVKIIYIDILREKHVVYFNRGKEIEESEYTHYIDANRQVFNTEFFSLNSIDYHHLKDVLDSRVYGKSCR